uniref:Gypsy retrotransposon integrase-like protein 1 n=1 Tax=Oryzias latipes TaxID=8090 RepID=A0A3B3HG52_ORYLA
MPCPGNSSCQLPATLLRIPSHLDPVLLVQPSGRWSGRFRELWRTFPLLLNVPQVSCLFPHLLVPLCCSGVHSSKVACHPGIHRTMALPKQRFWWPSISADTREFVQACSVCARGKASHRAQASLLQPLPVPHRPWSHIAVDFITGLPPSEGNTTVLTIVDRFSKSVHFVPVSKLPSALVTANLLVQHVFGLHGLPQDIVSHRGPQFTSKVWNAFCRAIGATARLSSGYHPQTNGQTERANQDLEAALRCVAASHPASWSIHLPWIEYCLVTSATSLSPFMASNGYQPLPFSGKSSGRALCSRPSMKGLSCLA